MPPLICDQRETERLRTGGGRKRLREIESITEKRAKERWIWRGRARETEMGATTRCVVGWQSAPPEATAVIKAVIEWTHIFISYWFISNSPLISGGHHRTVAFLLPRLRSSAPPDITVVITALPPRKLFTVSYSSKNWMSILEEKADEGRRGKKKHWLKGRNQRQQGYHLQACSLTKQNYNGREQLLLCYFSLNCQSARSVQSSGWALRLLL